MNRLVREKFEKNPVFLVLADWVEHDGLRSKCGSMLSPVCSLLLTFDLDLGPRKLYFSKISFLFFFQIFEKSEKIELRMNEYTIEEYLN